jgi:penicillin-insensitive murein endopeptidase
MAYADFGWSEVRAPLTGPSRVIGSYVAGCVAGAVPLPLVGEGFQVMRPSRNRFYGHPTTIDFIEDLGRDAVVNGRRLLIGDISQPRGGPMSDGHRSHQIGLDADIWFQQVSETTSLSHSETETLPMPSMVKASEGRMDRARWSVHYRNALEKAARSEHVERIFVNPVIKLSLCRSEVDRSWLHKLRPWWGHDAHFHVRFACPYGQAYCRGQRPPPPGDGCDEGLENWVQELQAAARSPRKPRMGNRKPVLLPAQCDAILRNPVALTANP